MNYQIQLTDANIKKRMLAVLEKTNLIPNIYLYKNDKKISLKEYFKNRQGFVLIRKNQGDFLYDAYEWSLRQVKIVTINELEALFEDKILLRNKKLAAWFKD